MASFGYLSLSCIPIFHSTHSTLTKGRDSTHHICYVFRLIQSVASICVTMPNGTSRGQRGCGCQIVIYNIRQQSSHRDVSIYSTCCRRPEGMIRDINIYNHAAFLTRILWSMERKSELPLFEKSPSIPKMLN